MSQGSGGRTASGRRGAIVTIAILFSCFYFFTGGGWNQASRYDLVRAIVDSRTLRIDAYQQNTGDKAFRAGHHYSDKAPGTAFLAVPAVAGTRVIIGRPGPGPGGQGAAGRLAEARAATLVSANAAAAVIALMLFVVARQIGASSAAAAIGSLAAVLGTPLWVYGTFFWGHALAGASLMVAYAAALALERAPVTPGVMAAPVDLPGRPPRRDRWLAVGVGAAGAWAVVTEYPAAGAAIIIGLLALWHARSGGRRRLLRVATFIAVGALGPALLLGSYNAAAFGSPFRLSYASVVGFEGMQEGIMGVSVPKAWVAREVLVSLRRGLLVIAPVLLAAPFGLWLIAHRKRRPAAALTALAVFVYYLLLNAGYHYWDGGMCYGPRVLGAGIAFLAVGLAAAWDGTRRLGRAVILTLALLSVARTLIAVAVHPMVPFEDWPRDTLLPTIWNNRLSGNDGAMLDGPTPSFNLGEQLGLKGPTSLLPLAAGWAILRLAWSWNRRRWRPYEPPRRGG